MTQPSIYLSTTAFGYLDVSELFSLTSSLSCDGLEIGSTHSPLSPHGAAVTLSQLNKPYIVHNYFPAIDRTTVLNPSAHESSLQYPRFIAAMSNISAFLNEASVSIYTLHPGFLFSMSESLDKDSQSIDFLPDVSSCVSTAQALSNLESFLYHFSSKIPGCKLLLENSGSLTSPENIFFDHPDVIAPFLDNLSPLGIGLNLNLPHLYLSHLHSGFNFDEALERLLPYTHVIEVSHFDPPYDSHLPLNPSSPVLGILRNMRGLSIDDLIFVLETKKSPLHSISDALYLLQDSLCS